MQVDLKQFMGTRDLSNLHQERTLLDSTGLLCAYTSYNTWVY